MKYWQCHLFHSCPMILKLLCDNKELFIYSVCKLYKRNAILYCLRFRFIKCSFCARIDTELQCSLPCESTSVPKFTARKMFLLMWTASLVFVSMKKVFGMNPWTALRVSIKSNEIASCKFPLKTYFTLIPMMLTFSESPGWGSGLLQIQVWSRLVNHLF